jgi:hypothetical protein
LSSSRSNSGSTRQPARRPTLTSSIAHATIAPCLACPCSVQVRSMHTWMLPKQSASCTSLMRKVCRCACLRPAAGSWAVRAWEIAVSLLDLTYTGKPHSCVHLPSKPVFHSTEQQPAPPGMSADPLVCLADRNRTKSCLPLPDAPPQPTLCRSAWPLTTWRAHTSPGSTPSISWAVSGCAAGSRSAARLLQEQAAWRGRRPIVMPSCFKPACCCGRKRK